MRLSLQFAAALFLSLWLPVVSLAGEVSVKLNAPATQKIMDEIAAAALSRFATNKLQSNQLAITLIDLRDSANLSHGSFRGGAGIYPASVVKLFYLYAAHRWMEDAKLQDGDELRRAMQDMIVESSNDATHYVLDAVTGTTSGPELPPAEMDQWREKRNTVNRFFGSLNYTNINVNQKPWCEGPYGRDRAFVGKDYDNRNALTTDATARLMTEIALEQAVTASRSKEMLKLLQREPFKKPNADEQATAYTGAGLPAGSKLWSKAGWTSTARHDAALVELPSGGRFVLVTFTTGHARDRDIIPFVTRGVVERLK